MTARNMRRKARPTTATAIRFQPEIHERLAAAAEDHDLPMNYLVNRAVAEYLDRLLPANEVRWTRMTTMPPNDGSEGTP